MGFIINIKRHTSAYPPILVMNNQLKALIKRYTSTVRAISTIQKIYIKKKNVSKNYLNASKALGEVAVNTTPRFIK